MTEEKNEPVQPVQSTQSVQSVQPAQPVQEESTTIIYASNNQVPFAAMLVPKKWAQIGNTYPMTTIQPDPSLKSPKFDWNEMKWFENDNAQKGIDMEELKQKVETLKDKDQESNAKIEQLLQLSIKTNKVLGQFLADKSKPSVDASPSVTISPSVTTSTDPKGGMH